MKKFLILIVSVCILLTCFSSSYAHPGSLDENGGHYNRKTGEYHYHEGDHTESTNKYSPTPSPTPNIINQEKEVPYVFEFLGTIIYIVVYLFLWMFLVGVLHDLIAKVIPVNNSKIIEYVVLYGTLCISGLFIGKLLYSIIELLYCY